MTTLNDIRPDGRYTIAESAQLMGLSVPTVYRYIASGRLIRNYNRLGKPYITGKNIMRLIT